MINNVTKIDIERVRQAACTLRLEIIRDSIAPDEEEPNNGFLRFRSDPDATGPKIKIGPVKTVIKFLNKDNKVIEEFESGTQIPDSYRNPGRFINLLIGRFLEPFNLKVAKVLERKPSHIIYQLGQRPPTRRKKKSKPKPPPAAD